MPDLLDQRIRQLQRLHTRQRCFDAWAPWLTLSLLLSALLIMLLRLSFSHSAWLEVPILLLGLLLPLLSLPRQLRQQLARRDLAAELDLLCQSRGLCMALAEEPVSQRNGDWFARIRRRLEDLQLPTFRWQAARFLPLVVICMLAAFLMPRAALEQVMQQRFAPYFDELITEIDQLAENDIITPELQEEKKQEVEQLKQTAEEQGMNQELWLARDTVKNYIDQQKHMAGQRLAEALVASEALEQQQHAERQEQLLKALANLAHQHKDMLKDLNQEDMRRLAQMMQGLEQMQLTPEQQQAMENLMRAQGMNQQQLMQMAQQQQQNGGKAGLDGKQAQEFGRDLLERLNKQKQNMLGMGMDMHALRMAMQGERGGTGRGPGHVQLHEERARDAQPGDVERLAPGARLNADGSITIAESLRDVEISDAALEAAVRAAARQFDPAAADARRSVTAPRHRATVQDYFSGAQTPSNPDE